MADPIWDVCSLHQSPADNTTGLLGLSLIQPAMQIFSSLVLLGTVAVQGVFGRPDGSTEVLRRAVGDWIETEKPIAMNKLLCNIGPNGCAASGAGLGVVVASPSKSNPDCK